MLFKRCIYAINVLSKYKYENGVEYMNFSFIIHGYYPVHISNV